MCGGGSGGDDSHFAVLQMTVFAAAGARSETCGSHSRSRAAGGKRRSRTNFVVPPASAIG